MIVTYKPTVVVITDTRTDLKGHPVAQVTVNPNLTVISRKDFKKRRNERQLKESRQMEDQIMEDQNGECCTHVLPSEELRTTRGTVEA